MKPLVILALAISVLLPASLARAERPSCRALFEACQRWCRDNRGGPERFVCKGNCQTEFNASLNSGIFHREDGLSVPCSRCRMWCGGIDQAGDAQEMALE